MPTLEFGDLGHSFAYTREGGPSLSPCLHAYARPLRLRRGVRRRSEIRRDMEGPAGLGLRRHLTRVSGEARGVVCLSATPSRHFHCLLSIGPLTVSQQAESEMPRAGSRLPKA